ncbi:MAG: ECF-type sigma factor [Bryobacteraceae bacterium]
MDSQTAEVTRLLRAWGGGDHAALDQLTPLVYRELHRMAGRYMQRVNSGNNTLQATALVNEAFLRLVDVTGVRWQDHAHAALAELLLNLVVGDLLPGVESGCLMRPRGPVQHAGVRRLRQQRFDLAPQVFLPGAGHRHKRRPFFRLAFRRRLVDLLDASPAG